MIPSADLATTGLVPVAVELLLTPSKLSKTAAWTIRFGSPAHVTSSDRAIRTSPHAVYSQNEWSSSSSIQ